MFLKVRRISLSLSTFFKATDSTTILRFESMMEGRAPVREVYVRVCREMKIGQP